MCDGLLEIMVGVPIDAAAHTPKAMEAVCVRDVLAFCKCLLEIKPVLLHEPIGDPKIARWLVALAHTRAWIMKVIFP